MAQRALEMPRTRAREPVVPATEALAAAATAAEAAPALAGAPGRLIIPPLFPLGLSRSQYHELLPPTPIVPWGPLAPLPLLAAAPLLTAAAVSPDAGPSPVVMPELGAAAATPSLTGGKPVLRKGACDMCGHQCTTVCNLGVKYVHEFVPNMFDTVFIRPSPAAAAALLRFRKLHACLPCARGSVLAVQVAGANGHAARSMEATLRPQGLWSASMAATGATIRDVQVEAMIEKAFGTRC